MHYVAGWQSFFSSFLTDQYCRQLYMGTPGSLHPLMGVCSIVACMVRLTRSSHQLSVNVLGLLQWHITKLKKIIKESDFKNSCAYILLLNILRALILSVE